MSVSTTARTSSRPGGSLSRAIGWAFAGGLLLALASSMLLARQITRPVRRLVAATRQVSEGTYADVPVPNSRDEIGELATAFGRMVEELREKDRLVAYFRTPATGDRSGRRREPATDRSARGALLPDDT